MAWIFIMKKSYLFRFFMTGEPFMAWEFTMKKSRLSYIFMTGGAVYGMGIYYEKALPALNFHDRRSHMSMTGGAT